MDGAPSAAPAAPAAASPNNTNGAAGQQTPAPSTPSRPNAGQQAKSAGETAKAPPGAVKGPDGRFVSPDSGTARPPKEKEPTEAQKEAYRFKRKLRDGDAEYEVDLDEDAIARDVSIAHAAKRRMGELSKRTKELEAREAKLAEYEKDPGRFLQERGVSAEEWAAKTLAQKATRGLMSPEEQRIAELQEKLTESETKWKQHEEQKRVTEQQAHEDALWKEEEPRFIAAIEKYKLPKDMSVLSFMSRVGEQFSEAFGPNHRPDPEHVVAETNAQLSRFADHFVFALPTEALAAKLGPERLKALMKLQMSRWQASQSSAEPVPREEAPPPPPAQDEARTYLSEADIRRRLAERYKGK